MASKLYQIMFQIAGNVQSSFGSSFASAQKQLSNTSKNINKIPQSSNSAVKSFGSLGKQIAGVALKIGGLVTAGIGIHEIVSAASESQQKFAQMDAVLKSTGGAAGMTKQQLIQLAEAQSKLTTYSKGTTIEAENMLLTFTNIKSNVFPQTIKAAENMATAMGTDAKSAAMTLGKALNDPSAGLSKLTKQGVTFTAAQKKQIKAMQEAGNTAGAQKVMLQELEKEFGGSAEAAGKTFGGQLTILKNQITGAGVSIASTLMPHLTNLISKINDNMPKIQEVITNLINKAQPYIKSFVSEATKIAANIIPKIKKAVTDAISTVSPYIKPIINDLIKIASNLLPSVGSANEKAKGPVLSLVKNGLNLLKNVLDWLANHGGTVKAAIIGIGGAFAGFKAIKGTVNTINNVKKGFDSLHTAAKNLKGGFDTVRIKAMYFQDALKKVGSAGLNGAKALGKLVLSLAKSAAGFAKSAAKAGAHVIALGVHKIATLASAAAEKIMTAGQWLLNAALNANPIGIIIIAIAGLVTALVILYKKNAAFRNFINAMMAGLKNVVGTVVKAVVGFFSNLGQKVTDIGAWIKNIWNNVIGFFAGLPGKFVSLVKNIASAIVHGFDNAVNFIKSLPSKALEWGKDFINGLINGIKNMIGKVGDAVKGIANKIKSFLHFSTPDEGPLKEYQKWPKDFIKGYTNGIQNNKNLLVNAVKGLAQDVSVKMKLNPDAIKNAEISSPMSTIRNYVNTSQGARRENNKNNVSEQSVQVTYQITINGNASKEDIYNGIKQGNDDLEKRLKKIKANRQRLSFSQG